MRSNGETSQETDPEISDTAALAAVLRQALAGERRPSGPQDPQVQKLVFLGLMRATAAGFEPVDPGEARRVMARAVVEEMVERSAFYAQVLGYPRPPSPRRRSPASGMCTDCGRSEKPSIPKWAAPLRRS
jgi:hypothetical protein